MKYICIFQHSPVFGLSNWQSHVGICVFAGNNIGDEGAKALAEALKVNQGLQDLNLTCRKNDTYYFISASLFPSFHWPSFIGNNIGSEGAKALAEALKVNQSLQNLNLNGIQMKHICDLLYIW